MKKATITEIKAAAKKVGCEIVKCNHYLNGSDAYKFIGEHGETIMPKDILIESYMRGDLF